MGEDLITQGGTDIQVIVTGVVGLITTITSSWVSWLFAKKKYNAEVDSDVIENMKQSLEFYTKLSDDNKARLEEALKRNEALEKEISQLRQQVFELMNNICYDLQCTVRKRQVHSRNKTKNGEKECNYDTKEGK